MCLVKTKMDFNLLPRIHNTSLISAYFGLDSCECKCLEYFFLVCSKTYPIVILTRKLHASSFKNKLLSPPNDVY
jgi:hypothetical protein